MATSINSVVLSGRLTRNAEIADYGKTSFSIAVDKKVKKGERWENVTNYFDIEAWRQPQFVNDSLTKGRLVVVSGSLDSFTYERDERKTRRIFVRADIIQVIPHKSEGNSEPRKRFEPEMDNPFDDDDFDDIP